MRRRGFTLIELLLVIAIVIIMAAILSPVFARPRESHCGVSCQSNLRQVGLGIAQYTQDYDERFPMVVTSGENYGWADAIQPYIKSVQRYQCPQDRSTILSAGPHAPGYTDYWFNANLSKAKMGDIASPVQLIVGGDGNAGIGGTDARYAKEHFPTVWLQDETSPAYRHHSGMNLLMADGHVKQYLARDLTPNETRAGLTMVMPTPTPPPALSYSGGAE